WALVARRGGEMVALAPLCTRVDAATGRRTTSLLGDGVSDYLDIVVAPEVAAESTAAVVGALARHCHEARSAVVLDELRDRSPLASFPAPAGVREEWFQREPCPSIRLTEEGDPLPRSMREKVRYYQRRAERIGPVTIEQAAPESTRDWLATLFALHGARWKARGGHGVLASDAVRRFQCDAVVAMTASGLARLYALRIGRRPAAVMLVLFDARTAYYYIGGFDP